MIDLTDDLRAALAAVSHDFESMVRRAIREEVSRLRGAGNPDDLLDASAAASLLGMTPAALRRAAERGAAYARPVRLGRRLRWRRGDLLAVLAERSGLRP